MEMETRNGSKIQLEENTDLGRGLLGFDSSDLTVSRRHVSFKLNDDRTMVYFQVKGKNPIWVRHSTDHQIIRVYKSSQQGLLNLGDSFCLSSNNPLWFHLKKKKEIQDESDSKIRYDDEFAEISGVNHDQIDTDDVSDIDPVKEFDFVVMGHEFDCYSKKLVTDIRNWNWFLEEAHEDSDEDKPTKKRKKGGRKNDDDDDVWTGESEEDVELVKKFRTGPKPKYSTRSKDKGRSGAGAGASTSVNDGANKKVTSGEDEDEDDDEDDDDETLGGFIVDDEDMGGDDEEEDEEDEFEEDEDDE